jgi:hypothetical protein
MSHLGSACLRRPEFSTALENWSWGQKAAFQQRQSDGTFVPADKTWSDYGSKQIENLAKDLRISRGELFRCIQFARQYPELSDISDNLIIESSNCPRGKFELQKCSIKQCPGKLFAFGLLQKLDSGFTLVIIENLKLDSNHSYQQVGNTDFRRWKPV